MSERCTIGTATRSVFSSLRSVRAANSRHLGLQIRRLAAWAFCYAMMPVLFTSQAASRDM
jgi:hypothetical protein